MTLIFYSVAMRITSIGQDQEGSTRIVIGKVDKHGDLEIRWWKTIFEKKCLMNSSSNNY